MGGTLRGLGLKQGHLAMERGQYNVLIWRKNDGRHSKGFGTEARICGYGNGTLLCFVKLI